ncbi:MAG TPA: CDP-alcohol phosphatidyltransferase family protein [Micromonosporaceae bacterium]|nr:CDP-alcohol phosphatidyltransferase family protein [Micromonosporaceae bacterium]
MHRPYTIQEIRSRTYKTRDAWWTVLLVDPLASRLVQLTAGYRWVTPNRLSLAAFALGVASAACFAQADRWWLVAGGLLFHLAFVVDCMDGKIARLNGTGSVFGVWLDFMLDQLRVMICTLALAGGLYAATDQIRYLVLGGAILVLDMFRYLNAWQIGKVKSEMRATMAARRGEPAAFVEEMVHELPTGAADGDDLTDVGPVAMDVNRDFRSKFAMFVRVRNWLVRHRIRIHLVSGIEFQMAAFVVGPITGLVIAAPAVAGAFLLVFELMLIYKLWLATRAFDRDLARLDAEDAAGAGPADGTAATIPGQRTPDGSALTVAP